MYPNPQDVLPLPPHPDVAQYRKRAKRLARACREGETAIRAWADAWVARVRELSTAPPDHRPRETNRLATAITRHAIERLRAGDCALSQAQFVMARAHGFTSWPALVHHLEELNGEGSNVSMFEQAADAIIRGDVPTLAHLLQRDPTLIRARSDREHRATLLHYVAANGVENYRQKTPASIVAVTRLLLGAGADIDAEAEVYGGGATTLGLVVTSAHPRLAGVQNALADLLLDRGATMGHGIIGACLANGCPEAAEHLAERGATVGLAEAAAIGWVDTLRQQLADGTASPSELGNGMIFSVWYGRIDSVTAMLEHGVDVAARGSDDGQTALHVAAFTGNDALVRLLLSHGAPVDVRDSRHQTTPLTWALHAWLVEQRTPPDGYPAVVGLLLDAGAIPDSVWLGHDRLRQHPDLRRRLVEQAGTA